MNGATARIWDFIRTGRLIVVYLKVSWHLKEMDSILVVRQLGCQQFCVTYEHLLHVQGWHDWFFFTCSVQAYWHIC